MKTLIPMINLRPEYKIRVTTCFHHHVKKKKKKTLSRSYLLCISLQLFPSPPSMPFFLIFYVVLNLGYKGSEIDYFLKALC